MTLISIEFDTSCSLTVSTALQPSVRLEIQFMQSDACRDMDSQSITEKRFDQIPRVVLSLPIGSTPSRTKTIPKPIIWVLRLESSG